MKTATLICILIASWFFASAQDKWIPKADFPLGARVSAASFTINHKAYVGTGEDSVGIKSEFWEYDPALDAWTQKANFSGGARFGATGFSIGNNGYMGLGQTENRWLEDFWKYDPIANKWTPIAAFGGGIRSVAVSFSINGKGYCGTGSSGMNQPHNDFWQYDPVSNTWTQVANFGGSERDLAVGFSINGKGYLGMGYSGTYKKDFWEYDPQTNSWSRKADFGGGARAEMVGFSIGANGYAGTGFDGFYHNDWWEYQAESDTWIQKTDFPGEARVAAVGFEIDNLGYLGLGYTGIHGENDLWKYVADTSIINCLSPTREKVTNVTDNSATLNWKDVDGALNYTIGYQVKGGSGWIIIPNISTSVITISNLLQATSYIWRVRSTCSVNPAISSDWSKKQSFTTTSQRLDAKETATFNIYPNPAKDAINISFPFSNNIITISDLFGREVQHFSIKNTNTAQLNISSLPEGVYIVSVRDVKGNVMASGKLFKE